MTLALNPRGQAVTKTVERYIYDAVGNRLQDAFSTNHVFNSSNQPISTPARALPMTLTAGSRLGVPHPEQLHRKGWESKTRVKTYFPK